MAPRFCVVTDSVADLPPAWIERYRVRVLPVYLILNGQSYRDDGALDRDWFYAQLATLQEKPTTAAPAPMEFGNAYKALAAEGVREIIAVFTASQVSSIFDHASLAARQVGEVQVWTVDSRQISMGIGWQVVAAAESVERGTPISETVLQLERMRERTCVYGVLDSLDYLRRSGRVSLAGARMGDLLKIKPLIRFAGGEAAIIGRVRTQARALDRLVTLVREAAPLERLAIIHSRAVPEAIGYLQQALSPMAPDLPIPTMEVGTVFATHIGPGGLGVALVSAERG